MDDHIFAPRIIGNALVQSHTTDVDEQATKLSRWDQVYEQLSPGLFAGSVREAWFGSLQLLRESTSQSVHQAGRAWTGSSTFGVPLHMDGEASFRGSRLRTEDALVLAGGDELDFRTPRMMDVVAVTVDSTALADYADKVEQCDIHHAPLVASRVVTDSKRAQPFGQFLLTTLACVFATPDLLNYPQLQKALEEAILSSVLALTGNDEFLSKPPIGSVSRVEVVRRAKEYVHSHVEESLTVADLCRELKISRRTLQYSFQDVLDLNPVAYIRAVRLNGARRELKAADPLRATVQDIAARWGFWHLSHFSTDYRHMFGELPSATLRQSR
jgi:AraC family ethanolamine operon transcriptional activator